MVDSYFGDVLHKRTPNGKFLLTRGRIAKDGIKPNERIVFTYIGEIVFQARALTGRNENSDCTVSEQYPHYFCVDLSTIQKGCKSLRELEDELKESKMIPPGKNLVKSQGWPIVNESDKIMLSKILRRFLK